jgi:hypothetical protein
MKSKEYEELKKIIDQQNENIIYKIEILRSLFNSMERDINSLKIGRINRKTQSLEIGKKYLTNLRQKWHDIDGGYSYEVKIMIVDFKPNRDPINQPYFEGIFWYYNYDTEEIKKTTREYLESIIIKEL